MLYTMKELLDRASAENYAIAAPNVGNSLDVDAAIAAAEEMNAPIILDVRFENLGPVNRRKACPRSGAKAHTRTYPDIRAHAHPARHS